MASLSSISHSAVSLQSLHSKTSTNVRLRGSGNKRPELKRQRAATAEMLAPEDENELNRAALTDKYTRRVWKLQTSLWLVTYLVFLFIFVSALLLARDIERNHEMLASIRDALIDEEFPFGSSHILKNFHSVQQASEFWDWLEGPFTSAITSESWYNGQKFTAKEQGYLYRYNKIIGGIRLRQLRVKEQPCVSSGTSNYFEQIYPDCYFEYSEDKTKDTAPFGPSNQYSYKTSAETHIPSEYGRAIFVVYGGGGYIEDIRRDNSTIFQEKIKSLKQNLWIDKKTRVVFITVNFFNGNLRQFAIAQMMVEFTAGGWVYPYYNITPFRLEPYVDNVDYLRMGLEIAIVFFLAVFTLMEIREVLRSGTNTSHKLKKPPILHRLAMYFEADLWNIVDWANLSVFWGVVALEGAYLTNSVRWNVDFSSNQEYVNLESLSTQYIMIYNIASFNVLLTVLKLFKYLQVVERLQVLWRTLYVAGKDLVAFVFLFIIVFLGFSIFGHLLFGTDMFEYRDINGSLMSCFRMILGEFDYRELWRINRILGPTFFLGFVILVYFMLANVFIAIVTEAWAIVMEPIRQKEERKARIRDQMEAEMAGETRTTSLSRASTGIRRVKIARTGWLTRLLQKVEKYVKWARVAVRAKRRPEHITTDFYNVVGLARSSDKKDQRKIINDNLGGDYPPALLESLLNDYRKIVEENELVKRTRQEIDPSLRPVASAIVDQQNNIEIMDAQIRNIRKDMEAMRLNSDAILRLLGGGGAVVERSSSSRDTSPEKEKEEEATSPINADDMIAVVRDSSVKFAEEEEIDTV